MEGRQAKVIENAEGARGRRPPWSRSARTARSWSARRPSASRDQPGKHHLRHKRPIGRRFDDPIVEKDKALVSYKIVRGDNGDAWVEANGKKYSPSQISAFILQKMKETAERHLGEKVEQAVIPFRPISTMPSARRPRTPARSPASRSCASSTNRRRQPSPTASTRKRPARSPSTISAAAPSTSRSSTSRRRLRGQGDQWRHLLGGEDFDKRIIDFLADEFKKQQGIDLRNDRLALQPSREAAEKAKIELSRPRKRASTCPSSRPTRTDPSTSTSSFARQVRDAGRRPRAAHDRTVHGGPQGCRIDAKRSTRWCLSAA
jgi:molecular chaperone DnaK